MSSLKTRYLYRVITDALQNTTPRLAAANWAAWLCEVWRQLTYGAATNGEGIEDPAASLRDIVGLRADFFTDAARTNSQ